MFGRSVFFPSSFVVVTIVQIAGVRGVGVTEVRSSMLTIAGVVTDFSVGEVRGRGGEIVLALFLQNHHQF